jgi:hypothetical protein
VKRAEIVKAGSVKVRPLAIEAFMVAEEKPVMIETFTRKKIRDAAKELGIAYDEEQILFTKKILTYLMKKQ